MFVWWNRKFAAWRRNVSGVMAIEFAIMLPLMLAVMVFIFEAGNLYYDVTVARKGMRAGVGYAVRLQIGDLTPTVDADAETAINNIVRYGDPTGDTTNLTMRGWSSGYTIAIAVDQRTVTDTDGTDLDLNVVTLDATVGYIPLFSGFFFSNQNFGTINITANHEQVHIGI